MKTAYIGKKVQILSFNYWSNRDYLNMSLYIGATATILKDWGNGHRFVLKYDDNNLQNRDEANGRLCFRMENLKFLTDEKSKDSCLPVSDLKMLTVGKIIVQTKALGGFDFVGEEFEITEIKDSIIIGKSWSREIGFGISGEEFFNYFNFPKEKEEEVEIAIFEEINGIKITRKGRLTLVELPTGTKGASKCLPSDTYNADIGLSIAILKAVIIDSEKIIKKNMKITRENLAVLEEMRKTLKELSL